MPDLPTDTARLLATRYIAMADWLSAMPDWLDEGTDRLFDIFGELEELAMTACGLEYPADPDELYEDSHLDPDYAATADVFGAFDPYEKLQEWLATHPE